MPFASIPMGLMLAGGSAAGGLASGIGGKGAAQSAADAQIQASRMAQQTQMGMYGQNRNDLSPYRDLGAGGISALSGQYGIPFPGFTNDVTGNSLNGFPGGRNGDQYLSTPSANSIIQPFIQPFSGGMGSSGYPVNLQNAFANFRGSPDYQFVKEQGNLGTSQQTNAQGWGMGGGQLRALDKFNSGLASTDYNQYVQNVLAASQQGLQAGGRALEASQDTGQQYQNYFNRLASLAGIGTNATNQTTNLGANAANQYAGLQTGAGAAQAAGIVGGFNALSGGLNSIMPNSLAYNYLGNNLGGQSNSSYSQANAANQANVMGQQGGALPGPYNPWPA